MTKKLEKKIEMIGRFSNKTYNEELSIYIIDYNDSYMSITYRIDKYIYDELATLSEQPTNKRLIKLWKLVRSIENDRCK